MVNGDCEDISQFEVSLKLDKFLLLIGNKNHHR